MGRARLEMEGEIRQGEGVGSKRKRKVAEEKRRGVLEGGRDEADGKDERRI